MEDMKRTHQSQSRIRGFQCKFQGSSRLKNLLIF
uniref:Uncharacterized protein n=1 Tax=Rhizophora mucronata TaxID=61149 RepID=A0A2P2N4Y3_RHIMU